VTRLLKACSLLEGVWALINLAVGIGMAFKVWPAFAGLRLAHIIEAYEPSATDFVNQFQVMLTGVGFAELAATAAVVMGSAASIGLWHSRRVGAYASFLLTTFWLVGYWSLLTLGPEVQRLPAPSSEVIRVALGVILLTPPVWRHLK